MNQYIKRILRTIRNYGESAVRRFPAASFMITVYSVMNIIFVLTEPKLDTVCWEAGAAFGCVFALCMEIAKEYADKYFKYFRYASFCAPVLSVLIALILHRTEIIYVDLAIGGLFTAISIMTFFFLYSKGSGYDRPVLSHVVKTGFLCSVFSGILFTGLTVCIAAFSLLIIGTEEMWKAIVVAGILTHMLFAPLLFISLIPKKDEEIVIPAIYRAIIHKGLFYIYLLLISILYLYIGKTIVTRHMPVGKYNWFGCFSLLFFIFFSLSVEERDGKIQQLFKKYGTFLMIPVIIMQAIGLGIRISAYGITVFRFLSIVLIAAALLFIVCMVRRIPLKYPIAGAAVIALIVTCTPLNIIDVPIRNQEKILRKNLTEAGALVQDGSSSAGQEVIDDTVTIDEEHMKKIASAYDYLDEYSYIKSISDKSGLYSKVKESGIAKQIETYERKHDGYGDEDIRDGYENFSYSKYDNEFHNEEIDISAYRKMILEEDGDSLKYKGADLKEFFLGLHDHDKDIRFENDEFCIIFTWISFDYKGDDIRDISWTGYVLMK